MAQDIPLLASNAWFRSVVPLARLDGTQLVISFDFRWNDRDTSWYFDVLDDSDQPIVSGVRFVRGVYLGRRANHELFRNGVLVAVGTVAGDTREADFDDLGARVVLRYYSVYDVLVGRRVIPGVLNR